MSSGGVEVAFVAAPHARVGVGFDDPGDVGEFGVLVGPLVVVESDEAEGVFACHGFGEGGEEGCSCEAGEETDHRWVFLSLSRS